MSIDQTQLWIIRCGFMTVGCGVQPNEEPAEENSWGPFYFSEEAANEEKDHYESMQPENTYTVEQTTIEEIGDYHTEFPALWLPALMNHFSQQ